MPLKTIPGFLLYMFALSALATDQPHPDWPISEELCAAGTAAATVDTTLAGSTGRAIAALVAGLRDGALAEGTEPIPADVRARLAGFVPDRILDLVRWRVGSSSLHAVHAHLDTFGLLALTLDHVVVFADRERALQDALLWAHELRHVMQYRYCGVEDFARAYLAHHQSIERDAIDYALAWHQWSLDNWLQRVVRGDD